MDFDTIFLTRKERRRFLEIAEGDTVAANTPDEDTLIRKELVTEAMLVKCDLSDNSSLIDMRGVKLSDTGEKYYGWYMNERQRKREESMRFCIEAGIAIAGIAVTVLIAVCNF